MTWQTSIVLAHAQQIERRGLRLLLESEAEFVVVGEASDGLQAIETVERLRPDILVIDTALRSLGAAEVTRRLANSPTKTRVVVLSKRTGEFDVVEALMSGAFAYVLKNALPDELKWAVREAAAGRRCLSSPFSARLLKDTFGKRKSALVGPGEILTNREREVLHLMVEGLTSQAMADRLFISRRTIESHRARVFRKLGFSTMAELVRYAFQHGILSLEDSHETPVRSRDKAEDT